MKCTDDNSSTLSGVHKINEGQFEFFKWNPPCLIVTLIFIFTLKIKIKIKITSFKVSYKFR